MKITSILHFKEGAIKFYADSIEDIIYQMNLIGKLNNKTEDKLNIPNMKTIYEIIHSVIILTIEISKKQRPIKNIEQLISEQAYRELSYKNKLNKEKNKEAKNLIVISQVFIQIDRYCEDVNVTATVQDGSRNRAFAFTIKKNKNKYIVDELEYA